MTAQRQVGGADSGEPPKRTIFQRVEAALAKMFRPTTTYHPEQYYLRGRPGPRAQAKREHDGER